MKIIEEIMENVKSNYPSVIQKLLSKLKTKKKKQLRKISQKYLVITGIDLWWVLQTRIDKVGILTMMLFSSTVENVYKIVNMYDRPSQRLQQLYILYLLSEKQLCKCLQYFKQKKGVDMSQYLQIIETEESAEALSKIRELLSREKLKNEIQETESFSTSSINEEEEEEEDVQGIKKVEEVQSSNQSPNQESNQQINYLTDQSTIQANNSVNQPFIQALNNSFSFIQFNQIPESGRVNLFFLMLHEAKSQNQRIILALQYFISTENYENAVLLLLMIFDGQEHMQKLCSEYQKVTGKELETQFKAFATQELQIVLGLFP